MLAAALLGNPHRQAPRFPIMLLAAFEDNVISMDVPAFWRTMSWWLLLQSWTTLRFDDHRCITPTEVSVSSSGLNGGLTRTKVSGPDKRHNFRWWFGPPPDARILDYVARLREEPESDDGSSPDEGVPDNRAGHREIGKPMQISVGYVQRDLCDGQSLASPGRWAPASRVYPSTAHWRCVADTFRGFLWHTRSYGKGGQVPFSSR